MQIAFFPEVVQVVPFPDHTVSVYFSDGKIVSSIHPSVPLHRTLSFPSLHRLCIGFLGNSQKYH